MIFWLLCCVNAVLLELINCDNYPDDKLMRLSRDQKVRYFMPERFVFMNKLKRLSCSNFLLVVLIVLLLVGCNTRAPDERDVDAVKNVLVMREQAIETKDLDLYKSIIHKEYSESGISFDDLMLDLEILFSNEGDISYVYQKARPSITMNSARVVHMVEYHFSSGKTEKIHEKLYLRKVNGKWVISGGMTMGLGR